MQSKRSDVTEVVEIERISCPADVVWAIFFVVLSRVKIDSRIYNIHKNSGMSLTMSGCLCSSWDTWVSSGTCSCSTWGICTRCTWIRTSRGINVICCCCCCCTCCWGNSGLWGMKVKRARWGGKALDCCGCWYCWGAWNCWGISKCGGCWGAGAWNSYKKK